MRCAAMQFGVTNNPSASTTAAAAAAADIAVAGVRWMYDVREFRAFVRTSRRLPAAARASDDLSSANTRPHAKHLRFNPNMNPDGL